MLRGRCGELGARAPGPAERSHRPGRRSAAPRCSAAPSGRLQLAAEDAGEGEGEADQLPAGERLREHRRSEQGGDQRAEEAQERDGRRAQPADASEPQGVGEGGADYGEIRVAAEVDRAGLVSRSPDPADRRSVLVTLTDEGRRIIDEAVVAGVEAQQRLLADLPAGRRRQLDELLRELLAAVSRS